MTQGPQKIRLVFLCTSFGEECRSTLFMKGKKLGTQNQRDPITLPMFQTQNELCTEKMNLLSFTETEPNSSHIFRYRKACKICFCSTRLLKGFFFLIIAFLVVDIIMFLFTSTKHDKHILFVYYKM